MSALALAACVATAGLWVRSCYWSDEAAWEMAAPRGIRGLAISSREGWLRLSTSYFYKISRPWPAQFSSNRIYAPSGSKSFMFTKGNNRLSDVVVIVVPHWILAVAWAAVAGAVWMKDPRRYGMRTLLVGMTLIAVLFGGIALSD